MKKLLCKLAVCSISGLLLFTSCDAFGPPDDTPDNGKDATEGFTLTYDLNYADIGEPPAAVAGKQAGDTVNVAKQSDEQGNWFGRDGYAFAGWNTRRDGTGAAYFPDGWETSAGYTTDESGSRSLESGTPLSGKGTVTFGDSDITLYAQWSEFSIVLKEDATAFFLGWHTDRALSRQTITIPSRVNTLPLAGIDSWTFQRLYLAQGLVIESAQLTKLDTHTFPDLKQLLSLNIPYITEIDTALHDYRDLHTITLGANVVFKVNGTVITLDNIDDLRYVYGFPLSYEFVKYYLDPNGGNKRAGTYSSNYSGINGNWTFVNP